MNNNTDLINFIESHGVRVVADEGEYLTAEDIRVKNNITYVSETSFPATYVAAKQFLNY